MFLHNALFFQLEKVLIMSDTFYGKGPFHLPGRLSQNLRNIFTVQIVTIQFVDLQFFLIAFS